MNEKVSGAHAIYTIGHSNHDPKVFMQLLKDARIQLVVDVRSHPGSRWATHANPDQLLLLLRAAGISYEFLGDSLGGQPEDPDCYDTKTGKADYSKIQTKDFFQQGIKRLLESFEDRRVCIMCAEEDPSSCHRNLLVGEALRRVSIQVLHIRGDGRIQTDEDLLKEKAGVNPNQLVLPLGDIH